MADIGASSWRSPPPGSQAMATNVDNRVEVSSQYSNQNGNFEKMDGARDEESEEALMRDFEYIKKHVTNVDPDVLYSLLLAEIDNPNRVNFILLDTFDLNIQPESEERTNTGRTPRAEVPNNSEPQASGSGEPNARSERNSSTFASEPGECTKSLQKRPPSETSPELVKKTKVEISNFSEPQASSSGESGNEGNSSSEEPEVDKNKFLNSLKEMFPDANRFFLLSECEHLKDSDDCARFIDTVMVNGLYPKTGDDSWNAKKTYSPAANKPKSVKTEKGDNLAAKQPPIVIDLDDEPQQDTVANQIDLMTLPISDFDFLQYMADQPNLLYDNLDNPPSTSAVSTETASKDYDMETSAVSSSSDVTNAGGRPKTSTVTKITFDNNVFEQVRIQPPGDAPGGFTSNPTIWPTMPSAVEETVTEDHLVEAEDEKSKWIEEQTANLVRIFPLTDPTFLKAEVAKMEMSYMSINEFVAAKLENNDMPSRAEYDKRIGMEELQNRYTKNFVIEDFLKAIPDPWTFFSDTKRDCSKYKPHSLAYLKSSFRNYHVKDIQDALEENNNNLYIAYQHLKKNVTRRRTSKRTDFDCSVNRPTTVDIQFLQEVAFIENKQKIKDYLESKRREKERKYEEARRNNLLYECQRCFDNEILAEDTVFCPSNHNFCKKCVTRITEAKLDAGCHRFTCLSRGCESPFTMPSLQNVLKPDLFSKILQAIQMEELRAAGIEGVVQCPFCGWATILPPEERIMTCLNPECLKESCRACKKLNHIPLRCEEVIKTEDLRSYLEKKMTLAKVSEDKPESDVILRDKFVLELSQLQEGIHDVTAQWGARIEELMNGSTLHLSAGYVTGIGMRKPKTKTTTMTATLTSPTVSNGIGGAVYAGSAGYMGPSLIGPGYTAPNFMGPPPSASVVTAPAIASPNNAGLFVATPNYSPTGGLVNKPRNTFKVLNVRRIFFKDKLSIYLHHQLEVEKKQPPPLGFEIDSTAPWMESLLNKKANEFFLFHGTSPEQVETIANFGFDDRLSRGGLYGKGTYFAENADKSDQYARPPTNRNTKFMFLARVTLGNPYKTTIQGTWIRPPPINNKDPSKLYDSIVAVSLKETGRSLEKYQEFIIFDRYQCLPEFVIEYQRVG